MSDEKDGVGTADTLADLRAELGTLEQRRLARERGRGMLGPGACNVDDDDFTIEGELLRQAVAAEQARIAELKAAIAAMQAALPLSGERQREIWRQVEERHQRPAQAVP